MKPRRLPGLATVGSKPTRGGDHQDEVEGDPQPIEDESELDAISDVARRVIHRLEDFQDRDDDPRTAR
jgi:hypothetical protein